MRSSNKRQSSSNLGSAARWASGLLLATTSLAACRRTPPPPVATPIAWAQSATMYRGRNGQVFALQCPPGGAEGTVWGTDLYSDDSSICTAALHSGRVSLQAGGPVQILIQPGAQAYAGSIRNNITTRNYAVFPGSFTIVGGAAPGLVAAPVPTADWSGTAQQYRAMVGQAVNVTCAPGGAFATVWGTDIYTDDSSVCTAAVHAGRIMVATGGSVTIYPMAGQPAYVGSFRNGVTTQNFASFGGSFAFTPAAPAPVAVAPPGSTTVAWDDNATRFRGQNGQAQRIFCPPGGTFGNVWGTGVYTDDSSVCTAAAHAGLITQAAGGAFTLRTMPGLPAYTGTARNGVTSSNFATFPGSFSVQP